jgi:hypothetical protein
MIVVREMVMQSKRRSIPATQPGWLRRLYLSALSLPGRIVALPDQ